MTTQQQHTMTAPAGGDPAVIDLLRQLADQADADADRLAEIGGTERHTAQEHLRRAAEADDAAMSARAHADRWRRHLEMELAAPPGATPRPIEQAPESRRGSHPYETQMRYCNGCGQPLRPASPEEMATVVAGGVLPDNRRDCVNCSLEAAAERAGTGES